MYTVCFWRLLDVKRSVEMNIYFIDIFSSTSNDQPCINTRKYKDSQTLLADVYVALTAPVTMFTYDNISVCIPSRYLSDRPQSMAPPDYPSTLSAGDSRAPAAPITRPRSPPRRNRTSCRVPLCSGTVVDPMPLSPRSRVPSAREWVDLGSGRRDRRWTRGLAFLRRGNCCPRRFCRGRRLSAWDRRVGLWICRAGMVLWWVRFCGMRVGGRGWGIGTG